MLKSARLKAMLWRRRGLLGVALVAIVVANGFALLQPYLLGRGIDALTNRRADRIPLIVLAIIAAAALDAGSRFVQRSSVGQVARGVDNEFRRDLVAHLEGLDQRFFQEIRTGDIMARATNDLSAVQQLLGAGLSSLTNTAVIFSVAFTLMLLIDWQLALLSVSLLGLLSLVFVVLGPQIQRRFLKVQEQFAVLSAKAQENFSGIRVVKAYVQEDAECAGFEALNRQYVADNIAWARINSGLWPLFGLIAGLAAVVLLYVGGRHVVLGRISLGQFVQFNSYLILLSWPMIALGWVANMLQQGAASLDRLEEILRRQPLVSSPPAPLQPQAIRGDIRFEAVSFRYADTLILDRFSLDIPAGTMLAVVGATGSGKSTLGRLLTRVWDPQEGRILLDGVDIRDLPLDLLRRQVGYVAQETFLFSDSLLANITLGVEDPPAEAVTRAAELSQLSADLEQFPEGLQTVIGERGVTLSGGQKQRTAIARAVIKDPAVLILDDALSSVDTRTEEAILQGLRLYMKGRTSVVIAHRLSTLKDADQIVVLEDGRIAEQGTHAQLLARGRQYAQLYERQALRRDLEEDEETALAGPIP